MFKFEYGKSLEIISKVKFHQMFSTGEKSNKIIFQTPFIDYSILINIIIIFLNILTNICLYKYWKDFCKNISVFSMKQKKTILRRKLLYWIPNIPIKSLFLPWTLLIFFLIVVKNLKFLSFWLTVLFLQSTLWLVAF